MVDYLCIQYYTMYVPITLLNNNSTLEIDEIWELKCLWKDNRPNDWAGIWHCLTTDQYVIFARSRGHYRTP